MTTNHETHDYAPAVLLELDPLHQPVSATEDDQAWDRQAEAIVRAAGLGNGRLNPDATHIADLFIDDEPASQAEINLLDQPIGWFYEEPVYG